MYARRQLQALVRRPSETPEVPIASTRSSRSGFMTGLARGARPRDIVQNANAIPGTLRFKIESAAGCGVDTPIPDTQTAPYCQAKSNEYVERHGTAIAKN